MDANRFQKDIEIDPGRLDLACVNQPALFFKWAERAITASTTVDKTKLSRDVKEAQLEMACRREPTAFGILKPTEGAIKAAIRQHDDWLKANEIYINAREESKLMDAAVNAMEQRKRMLEVLITLHGQQYFAGPSVPRDLVADWKEQQAANTKSINEIQKQGARRRSPK